MSKIRKTENVEYKKRRRLEPARDSTKLILPRCSVVVVPSSKYVCRCRAAVWAEPTQTPRAVPRGTSVIEHRSHGSEPGVASLFSTPSVVGSGTTPGLGGLPVSTDSATDTSELFAPSEVAKIVLCDLA